MGVLSPGYPEKGRGVSDSSRSKHGRNAISGDDFRAALLLKERCIFYYLNFYMKSQFQESIFLTFSIYL